MSFNCRSCIKQEKADGVQTNQSELSSDYSSVSENRKGIYPTCFLSCCSCVRSRFNSILVSRSFSQLKATFDEYSKVGVVISVMHYIMDYSAFSILKLVIFADK